MACALSACVAVSLSARACDVSGDTEPETLAPAPAAALLLYGRDATYTYFLYGQIEGDADSEGRYPIRVLHSYRGGLDARIRASVEASTCHAIRPVPGLRAVFYGRDDDALEIAGSSHFDSLPDSDRLNPALQHAARQRAPIEIKPWWKFW